MADQIPTTPAPIEIKAGLSTSSGQFTAIFTLVALILGLLGFHYSASQIEGWVQLVEKFLVTIGPLLAAIPVLMTYINSRGKIVSNTVAANAQVLAPAPIPAQLMSGGVIGSLVGGDDWKDPQRYEGILHIAKELGVPGAAQADNVNQQIHPAELITGILSMFHKKTQ